MAQNGDRYILKQLHSRIENELARVGILARVFSRVKTKESLDLKENREPGKYSSNGKKIQDLFGIRVTIYFTDDNETVQELLKNSFNYDNASSTIDTPNKDSFTANRCNLIFKLDSDFRDRSELLGEFEFIDTTFEVQLRSVLSEGWHEVEHDLRYKCQDDWSNHSDLSRALNGIYASLETSDWSMLTLFDQLAYRHFKTKEWPQMLRTKFRLRAGGILDSELIEIFNSNPDTVKKLFRVDRRKFISKLVELKVALPVNLNNIVYLSNYYFINCQDILAITPRAILNEVSPASE